MMFKSIPLDIVPSYPLHNITDINQVLFIDIETTGFSPKTSYLYLIGGLYYKNSTWHLVQWFANTPKDEKELLISFADFCKSFQTLIHFNGNGFDLPYLAHKFTRYKRSNPLIDLKQIDLYKMIRPYKSILRLPNLKQKTLETFLQIHREDPFTGGDLIPIYKEYCSNPDSRLEKVLLLHNHEDMLGMIKLLSLLFYADFFKEKEIQFSSFEVLDEKLMNNQLKIEGLIYFTIKTPLPIPFSFGNENLYLKITGTNGCIKFLCTKEELKFHYPNYKDYYYLPLEDMAIHKSVASYVDKEFREQAKAATCYTRKTGIFCPQNELLFSPHFKRNYKDTFHYFELTEDFQQNTENLLTYAKHLLHCLIQGIIF
jgi:Predicted exonuclease